MDSQSDPPDIRPGDAAIALAALTANRASLVDRGPHRPPWYFPLMTLLLSAGIASWMLHSTVINVITLPFVVYASVSLTGLDEWERLGVAPRRRGLHAAAALAYLLAVPIVWGYAVVLDRDSHHWALPAACIAVPAILNAGRVWLADLDRRNLLKQ